MLPLPDKSAAQIFQESQTFLRVHKLGTVRTNETQLQAKVSKVQNEPSSIRYSLRRTLQLQRERLQRGWQDQKRRLQQVRLYILP